MSHSLAITLHAWDWTDLGHGVQTGPVVSEGHFPAAASVGGDRLLPGPRPRCLAACRSSRVFLSVDRVVYLVAPLIAELEFVRDLVGLLNRVQFPQESAPSSVL